MTSTRPYLLRAIYDWLVDNQLTPHLLVDTRDAEVQVPEQFIENGMIVLNVSPNAVRDLELGNEMVSFNARFAGVAQDIFVPIDSVQAIYSRENGQGIFLGDDSAVKQAGPADDASGTEATAQPPSDDKPRRPGGGPHLTIVK